MYHLIIFVKAYFFPRKLGWDNSAQLPVEQDYHKDLLRFFFVISLILHSLIFLVGVTTAFFTGQLLEGLAVSLGALGGLLFGYRQAIKSGFKEGYWWLLGCNFIAISVYYFFLDITGPFLLLLLFPVALTMALGFTKDGVVLISLLVFITTGLYLAQHLLNGFAPFLQTLVNLALLAGGVPALVALLILPTNARLHILRSEVKRLQIKLADLEASQSLSQQHGLQIASVAEELNTISLQQSAQSQQQVTLVGQVNASASQLSSTATSIAELSRRVNQSAQAVMVDCQLTQATTKRSAQQSEKGLEVIRQAVLVSSEVAKLYKQLTTLLNGLQDKSASMLHILELIKSIARETHLLSLNAAIEAAGAGEYGERFGVVAREVKDLADRSNSASLEVVKIVQEIGEATVWAVTSAQSGYEKASEMEQVIGQAGEVIENMHQVTTQASTHANSIIRTIQKVVGLSEMIKSSTSQQLSTNRQLIEAMQGLQGVAEENASESNVISNNALTLEKVSHRLTTVPI